MIGYRWKPRMGPVFICDACKSEIKDRTQVRLLRAMAALPEEPTYTAHSGCVAHFTEQHEDQWEVFGLSHPFAAWVL